MPSFSIHLFPLKMKKEAPRGPSFIYIPTITAHTGAICPRCHACVPSWPPHLSLGHISPTRPSALIPASRHKPGSATHAQGPRQGPPPESDWLAPFPQPPGKALPGPAVGAPASPRPSKTVGALSGQQGSQAKAAQGSGGHLQHAQPSWASDMSQPPGAATQDSMRNVSTHVSTGPQ